MASKLKESISKDDITELMISNANIKQLFMYAKELNVNIGKDKSNLKQNLLLKVLENKKAIVNSQWYTNEFTQRKLNTIKEEGERKKVLSQYLEDVYDIHMMIMRLEKVAVPEHNDIITKEDPLVEKLKNEYPDIEDEFNEIKLCIRNTSDCCLLVCGDSGAGKSSFINLLIGQPILPTSIQSNTSCQVRLTYGEEEHAVIIDNDGKKQTIPKSEFSTTLRQYLENKNDRKVKTCQNATIYLKSSVLEGGLDIYDTIGLGESEKFNEEIKKDFREITGVIFLLKKNNPLGDNAIGGLSRVINYMVKDGLPAGSMNFIINMCDLLKDEQQKDQLRDNVLQQLQDKCSNILRPTISTFSTRDELFLQENKKMSIDYQTIMNQIKILHLNSICTNSNRAYQFLNNYCSKVIISIKELEQLSGYNEKLKTKHINQMKELKIDRFNLNQTFKRNNALKLKQSSEAACRDITKYLWEKKENVILKITEEQNQLFGLAGLDKINEKIMIMTDEKIIAEIEHFNYDKSLLKKLCDDLIDDFLKHFVEHEKNKEKLQSLVDNHINNVVNLIHGDITKINLQDILLLPPHKRTLLKVISPVIGPPPKPRGFSFNFLRRIYILQRFNQNNLTYFFQNTEEYIRKICSERFNSFVKSKQKIKEMVEFLYSAPRSASNEFIKLLDDDLLKLEKNIRILEDDLRKKDEVLDKYKIIKEKIETIDKELWQLYLLHLPNGGNYYMKSDVIRTQRDETSPGKSVCLTYPSLADYDQFYDYPVKPLTFSQSCTVFKAKLNNPNETKGCLVYINLKNNDWRRAHRESEILRNIPEPTSQYFITIKNDVFYSILEEKTTTMPIVPTFFTDELTSLRRYFEETKTVIKENSEEKFKRLKELLKQICHGLSFLHAENLVHFDMNINALAYNVERGLVKLTSISEPTEVDLDANKINGWHQVLVISHFPLRILESSRNSITKTIQPNIPSKTSTSSLRKRLNTTQPPIFYSVPNLYTVECDIYGLASVIYCLWMGIHIFSNEILSRVDTIDQLVSILKTKPLDNIINHYRYNDGFSDQILSWTRICLHNDMTAEELYKELTEDKYYGAVKCAAIS